MTSGLPALTFNRRSSRAALFGVSLLIHALLAYLFLLAQPRSADPQRQRVSMDLVWIRTPPPRPAALPVPVAAPVVLARARAMTVRTRKTAPVTRELAPAPAVVTEPVVAAQVVTPEFDREAALAAARTIATEPERWQAGMAIPKPAARPVYSETKEEKLGRMIAGAKRGNCIGPNAPVGNLLTPLGWLLDKKGGGCKF